MSLFKDCWLYLGSHNKQGYGHAFFEGKVWLAHRVSWLSQRGSIPSGMNVLHRCDNKTCINPKHLYLGTYSDNLRDVYARTNRSQFGDKNGNAKLTKEQVNKIRKLLKKKIFNFKQLAYLYGVSDSNIEFIAHGITWNQRRKKHVII